MALSVEDKMEIRDLITTLLHHGCLCGLNDDTRNEVGHFFGRIKDLGAGNMNQGIEIFSKAVEMVARHRRFGEKLGGAVAIFFFVTLSGGVLTAVWLGLKAMLNKEMP